MKVLINSLLALLFFALLILVSFYYLDRLVASFFYHYLSDEWKQLAIDVAYVAKPWVIALFGGLCIIAGIRASFVKFGLKPGQWYFWGMSIIVSLGCSYVAKIIVCRPRPVLFMEDGAYGFGMWCFARELLSFPSGHTVAATALVLPAMLIFKKAWLNIFSIVFVALIALLRVVSHEHFISDVLGGFAIASVLVFTMYSISKVYMPLSREPEDETLK